MSPPFLFRATQLNEPTNQNFLIVPKVVNLTKTIGTMCKKQNNIPSLPVYQLSSYFSYLSSFAPSLQVSALNLFVSNLKVKFLNCESTRK